VFCLSEAVYTLFVSKTTSARQPRRRESSNLCEYLCTKPASSTRSAEEPAPEARKSHTHVESAAAKNYCPNTENLFDKRHWCTCGLKKGLSLSEDEFVVDDVTSLQEPPKLHEPEWSNLPQKPVQSGAEACKCLLRRVETFFQLATNSSSESDKPFFNPHTSGLEERFLRLRRPKENFERERDTQRDTKLVCECSISYEVSHTTIF